MLKKFTSIVLLIASGSIAITFAITHSLQPTVFWTLFIGGTVLNIGGVLLLNSKFRQLNKIEEKIKKINKA
ncbi:hypothetical protein [Kurthia sibirica]|uniref:Uncharacterized protein n=1 Tax=Kurthia sibirica TaxID=202750 RepID=A0A2U3AKI6_9BACL|nr:hypothetical protein [Kurthia sibirica]PWI25049.1 hypothetical protein DEX24_09895 [Kurthia sibirica]GEK34213.1 hypothetical protein KSI01_17460 [Kurthia sibirica]